MAWEKGKPRPPGAGRKPGSLNKGTLAEQACAKLGFSPFEALVKVAQSGDIGAIIQLCKHIQLAPGRHFA